MQTSGPREGIRAGEPGLEESFGPLQQVLAS